MIYSVLSIYSQIKKIFFEKLVIVECYNHQGNINEPMFHKSTKQDLLEVSNPVFDHH
jgi:hypothetical protein